MQYSNENDAFYITVGYWQQGKRVLMHLILMKKCGNAKKLINNLHFQCKLLFLTSFVWFWGNIWPRQFFFSAVIVNDSHIWADLYIQYVGRDFMLNLANVTKAGSYRGWWGSGLKLSRQGGQWGMSMGTDWDSQPERGLISHLSHTTSTLTDFRQGLKDCENQ